MIIYCTPILASMLDMKYLLLFVYVMGWHVKIKLYCLTVSPAAKVRKKAPVELSQDFKQFIDSNNERWITAETTSVWIGLSEMLRNACEWQERLVMMRWSPILKRLLQTGKKLRQLIKDTNKNSQIFVRNYNRKRIAQSDMESETKDFVQKLLMMNMDKQNVYFKGTMEYNRRVERDVISTMGTIMARSQVILLFLLIS